MGNFAIPVVVSGVSRYDGSSVPVSLSCRASHFRQCGVHLMGDQVTIRNLERLLAPRSVALVGASPRGRQRRRHRGAQSAARRIRRPDLARQSQSQVDRRRCLLCFAGRPAGGARSRGGRDAAADRSRRHRASRRAGRACRGGHHRRPRQAAPPIRCSMRRVRTACASRDRTASGCCFPASASTPASPIARPRPAISPSSRSRARSSRRSSTGRPSAASACRTSSRSGDMADADFGDFLDYLAGDRTSRAILIYMEQMTAAPKFVSAARRAARAKPVIVLKSGRNADGRQGGHVAHRRAGGLGRRLQRRLPARRRAARARVAATVRCRGDPVGRTRARRRPADDPHERRRRRRARGGSRWPTSTGRSPSSEPSTIAKLERASCRRRGRAAIPSTSSAMPARSVTRTPCAR